MKFIIERVSDCGCEKKPCKGAFKFKINKKEIRTCKTFKEFDERFSKNEGKWCDNGLNHRINKNGHIERVFNSTSSVWCIEISSLEELLEFTKKECHCVIDNYISSYYWDKNNAISGNIEIYDTYRE